MGEMSDLAIDQELDRLFSDWDEHVPEGHPDLDELPNDETTKDNRPNFGLTPFHFNALLVHETDKGLLLLVTHPVEKDEPEWFPKRLTHQLEEERFKCPRWLAQKKEIFSR